MIVSNSYNHTIQELRHKTICTIKDIKWQQAWIKCAMLTVFCFSEFQYLLATNIKIIKVSNDKSASLFLLQQLFSNHKECKRFKYKHGILVIATQYESKYTSIFKIKDWEGVILELLGKHKGFMYCWVTDYFCLLDNRPIITLMLHLHLATSILRISECWINLIYLLSSMFSQIRWACKYFHFRQD